MREFAHSLVINAPSAAVLDAFFDSESLGVWWQVSRSVCIPRPLGSYAVEWPPTEWRDEHLGRLGGAFHATVMEFKPGQEFFLADAYWLPPDGDPLGPMALEATCSLQGDMTAACASCVPWEKLSRKTSTPASMRSRIASSLLVAGPMVATMFVARTRGSLQYRW